MIDLKTKTAFTLAEVLITLVIIGVIAAMTIPTLIANHRRQEVATKLKKSYMTISQAINRSIIDNGFPDTWTFPGTGDEKLINYAKTYILPYLQTVKICTPPDTCFPMTYSPIDGAAAYSGTTSVTAILADGTAIGIFLYGDAYSGITVDINGDKGPNTFGRDTFNFRLAHTRELMEGIGGILGMYHGISLDRATSISRCKTNTGAGGRNCGDIIMADGWQIKDDYPWKI